MEAALRAVRAGRAAALQQLLLLTRPEVREVARAMAGPRCPLSLEELAAVGEARLVELRAWERFSPGRERGRTLWPAYARRVARQAMATALEQEGPVHITRWARRRRAALEARAEAEGRTLEEVLADSPEGGAAAALLEAPRAVPEEVLLRTEEDTTEREERGQEALAVVHLARLPVRERVAVAGPLGLLAEGKLSDVRLAKHLRCTVAEVLELRERGLERLREAMGG